MSFSKFDGGQVQSGFSVKNLFAVIQDATVSAKIKLMQIKNRRSAISIGDMFEMQMLMNHLSQLSEMATSVVSASNSAISRTGASRAARIKTRRRSDGVITDGVANAAQLRLSLVVQNVDWRWR
jgi:hypothetical protein